MSEGVQLCEACTSTVSHLCPKLRVQLCGVRRVCVPCVGCAIDLRVSDAYMYIYFVSSDAYR